MVKRGIGKVNEKLLYRYLFDHKKINVRLFASYPVTLIAVVYAMAHVEELSGK